MITMERKPRIVVDIDPRDSEKILVCSREASGLTRKCVKLHHADEPGCDFCTTVTSSQSCTALAVVKQISIVPVGGGGGGGVFEALAAMPNTGGGGGTTDGGNGVVLISHKIVGG